MDSRLEATASPENLLEMQILKPHFQTQWIGNSADGSQKLGLLSKSPRGSGCALQFENDAIMNLKPSLVKWPTFPYSSTMFPNDSASLQGIQQFWEVKAAGLSESAPEKIGKQHIMQAWHTEPFSSSGVRFKKRRKYF